MKYLLIALVFISCKNPFAREAPPLATEVLDTIKTAPPTVSVAPALFETAFVSGTTHNLDKTVVNFYGITIGNIKVVTGRVVICDPLHIDEYGIPFTQAFPTGEFPVQLSIAKVDNGELTAFARIKFSDEPVAKWEFALQQGQEAIPVGGKKMHGYGVDGGVAIFIDEEASKALDQKLVQDFDGEVFKEMDKHYHNDWKYTMYNFGKYNLAAFSTGLGDGRYATYIGFDANGNPCRLLTDFRVVDWKQKVN